MSYASRPLADFNKYEASEMLESLQHTAQDTKKAPEFLPFSVPDGTRKNGCAPRQAKEVNPSPFGRQGPRKRN